jgi:hypothetical protein
MFTPQYSWNTANVWVKHQSINQGAKLIGILPGKIFYKDFLGQWLYGSWIFNYLCNQCLAPLKLWDSVKTCNNAETRQRNQTNAELMLCTIIVQMNPYTKTLHTATIIVNKKLYDIHDIYCRKRYPIFQDFLGEEVHSNPPSELNWNYS